MTTIDVLAGQILDLRTCKYSLARIATAIRNCGIDIQRASAAFRLAGFETQIIEASDTDGASELLVIFDRSLQEVTTAKIIDLLGKEIDETQLAEMSLLAKNLIDYPHDTVAVIDWSETIGYG